MVERAPFLILGDGAAGIAAAEHLRRQLPDAAIRIVSDEPHPAYYRAALTNYLQGALAPHQLHATTAGFYRRHALDRSVGRVTAVDPAERTVGLETGERLSYRGLLIATGARPRLLDIPGSTLPGVTGLRTLPQAQRLLEALDRGEIREAVVVGGGPLALEWVHGLRHQGVAHPTLLLRRRALMAGVLDARESDIVIARMERDGIRVRIDEVAEAHPGPDGRLTRVTLRGGDTLRANLLGQAIGILPNTGFLQGSGIEVGPNGIPVDPYLSTNCVGVFAAGDVAVVDGTVLGLWAPARTQGGIAGHNLAAAVAGTGTARRYSLGVHYFATRLYDLDVASASVPATATRELRRSSNEDDHEQRLTLDEHGHLVGFTLLGSQASRVRRRGRLFRRLIEAGQSHQIRPADIEDHLLDPHYDLEGWLKSRLPAAGTPTRDSGLARTASLRRATGTRPKPPRPTAGVAVRVGGTTHTLRGPTIVGRSPTCDIVLSDEYVSAIHAELRPLTGGVLVVPSKPTNAIEIHGKPTGGRIEVACGGSFTLGYTEVEVVVADPIAGTRSSAAPGASPKPAAAPAPALTVRGGGHTRSLDVKVLLVGSHAKADIQLLGPGVARFHAEIVREHGAGGVTWWLRDLGSEHGTFVDGAPVTLPVALTPGARIRLGEVELDISDARERLDPSPSELPAPPEEKPPPRPSPAEPKPLALRLGDRELSLDRELRIGRDASWAGLVLGEDDAVSGRHATLSLAADSRAVLVVDHGSTNGTQVDARLLRGAKALASLGSTILVGDTPLQVVEASR